MNREIQPAALVAFAGVAIITRRAAPAWLPTERENVIVEFARDILRRGRQGAKRQRKGGKQGMFHAATMPRQAGAVHDPCESSFPQSPESLYDPSIPPENEEWHPAKSRFTGLRPAVRGRHAKEIDMSKPLMAKATAVWLVDNTTLSFKQIGDFCGLHELEVQGIADGDVAAGVKGYDPVASHQLDPEEIRKGEASPTRSFVSQ